jgi:general secretion pathway protein G
MHRRARAAASMRGFTLLELLVVLAILAMIASFAAPQVFRWLGGARVDAARVQIESLSTGIDLYRLDVGSYPPDLQALVERPPGLEGWNGPYLRRPVVPRDPWNNEFVYRYPGVHGPYDLMSLGADGMEGGEGENRDIVSWE